MPVALSRRSSSFPLGLAALVLLALAGPAEATPTIRQNRWIILGPIQNAGDDAGEIGFPDPTPGHDLFAEFPKGGDDWGNGEIPFIEGASTKWIDLKTAPDFQCVCFDLLYSRDLPGPHLPIDRTKAVAITYLENLTGQAAPVNACLSAGEATRLWINRDQVCLYQPSGDPVQNGCQVPHRSSCRGRTRSWSCPTTGDSRGAWV
jgi:hypothetical protein